MSIDNEWELSSGFALDGATCDVTACEFGFNNNIGAGILCANFTFLDIETGEESEQSFSLGKGWETDRTGNELISETGKPKRISKNCNYGRLLGSAIELVDNPAEDIGSPKQADTWVGTRWTLGTVKVVTTNPSTGKEAEKDAFVFTEFHGRPEGDDAGTEDEKPKASGARKASGSAKKATGARKASGAKKASDSDIPEGIEEALWNDLVEMAKGADDHEAFCDQALEDERVDGNKAAERAVMGTAKGSVWAAAGK